MITLHTEELDLGHGEKITVSEENWDISMRMSEAQRLAPENPLPDKRLQYFRERIYPFLSSCSSGDVPSLEEAYGMLGNQKEVHLDGWWKMVQRINPDWFKYTAHQPTERVVFSDRSELDVFDGNVPSVIMKLRDMEEASIENPVDDLNTQVFRAVFYPKLAACSRGAVPDEATTRLMPIADTNRWYETANRVNPHWYQPLIDMQVEAQKQNETIKKKRTRPRK